MTGVKGSVRGLFYDIFVTFACIDLSKTMKNVCTKAGLQDDINTKQE